MSPERIVILNDSSLARGGATGLALLSARLLAARGCAVTLICGDTGESEAARALAGQGVEIVALGGARLMEAGRARALRQGLWNGAARALVADWVARRDTAHTVYHVHSWAQILSPALFSALAPVAPRVMCHAHDMFLACPNGVYFDFRHGVACLRVPLSGSCLACRCDKRSDLQKAWRVTRQTLLRRAMAGRAMAGRAMAGREWGPVAMLHPAMREPLERGGVAAARLRVLRNPAQPFTPERIAAEDNAGVLFVGRLERDKGVFELAEAAAQAEMPLVFVGDGPARESLTRRFPAARITGWLEKDAFGPMVRDARLLAMPSLHPEPFGLVAAEASMSGLPVVLSDRALMAQDIEAGGLGFAYGAQDKGGLAQALRRVRDLDKPAIAAMSLRGWSRKRQIALDQEAWTRGMMALYAEMLGETA